MWKPIALGLRKTLNARDEQLGSLFLPLPWGVDGADMAESAFRDVRIIGRDEAGQGVFVVLAGAEAARGQDLADAAVEAFDHAVCLGVCGLDEPVLHAAPGPGGVKRIFAGGLALAARAARWVNYLPLSVSTLATLKGALERRRPRKPLAQRPDFLGRTSR
jgi:hypothetical protein